MVPIYRFGIVALLLVGAESALALGLGAAQVKSGLGQPLNVLIPLVTEQPSSVDSSCFALKEVLNVLSKPEAQIAEDVAANDVLDWDL